MIVTITWFSIYVLAKLFTYKSPFRWEVSLVWKFDDLNKTPLCKGDQEFFESLSNHVVTSILSWYMPRGVIFKERVDGDWEQHVGFWVEGNEEHAVVFGTGTINALYKECVISIQGQNFTKKVLTSISSNLLVIACC